MYCASGSVLSGVTRSHSKTAYLVEAQSQSRVEGRKRTAQTLVNQATMSAG